MPNAGSREGGSRAAFYPTRRFRWDTRKPRIVPDEKQPRLACFALLTALIAAPATAIAQGAVTRAAILQAEDARGKGPDGLAPILAAIQSGTHLPLALRALGRLEQPRFFGDLLVQHLQRPELTSIVAEAIAQSLQGLRADSITPAVRRRVVDSAFIAMKGVVSLRPNATILGDIARSIARLPFDESDQARSVETFLLTLAPAMPGRSEDAYLRAGIAQGLYTLARARRTLGALSREGVEWLRVATTLDGDDPDVLVVRRLAWLALAANATVDRRDVARSFDDPDFQVRRLAAAALPNVSDSTFQQAQLARLRRDAHWLVRLEWVRLYRVRFAAEDCRPLVSALSDPVHHVRLAAIDALGGQCPATDTVQAVLRRLAQTGPEVVRPRAATQVSWHARAHALVSLARIDSAGVRTLVRANSRHPVWQVRMYTARAAAIARDSLTLSTLAFDSVGSVRQAAIEGLSTTLGHVADMVFAKALESKDYHVVLAAARALRESPVKDSVLPPILTALERLGKEQKQTSRDPRMELLARVGEMATKKDIDRLTPLLADIDEAIALRAGRIVTQLGGPSNAPVPPRPVRGVTPPSGTVRVRVTMAASSGGGYFDLLLDADRAPFTVARVLQLVRNRYYDGLTFHRVLPNFVLQGGSPGMNEYVGDGPFMRDELSLAHHLRGSVGTSTRGRDTGDAQWFINMVDNYRLDHDYTVFATIVAGMDVVDRILEGDVMSSVRIVSGR